MRFAVALPWWGYALAFAAALGLAWHTYAAAALPSRSRALLTALRALTLLLLVAAVLRPVRLVPPASARDRVVPILVDVSRSMRIADDEGPARLERARSAAAALVTALAPSFRTEVWTFGDGVVPGNLDQLQASAGRSDIGGALTAIADRYRGRALGGIVVISDGGDTAMRDDPRSDGASAPVFTVGVGTPAITRDREIVAMTAGEPRLADSTVDVHVSALEQRLWHAAARADPHGQRAAGGRAPRAPAADGAPVHTVFTVSPDRDGADRLPGVGPGGARRDRRREQQPQRAGGAAGTPPAPAAGGGRAGLRAHVPEAGAGPRHQPRRRFGGAQGRRPTTAARPSSCRPPPRAPAALAGGLPREPRRALRLRRRGLRQHRSGVLHPRPARDRPRRSSPCAAAGCWCFGGRSFEQQGLAGTPLDEVLPVDMSDRRALSRGSRTSGRAGVPRSPSPPTAPTIRRRAVGATADEAGAAGRRCRRWRRSRSSAAPGPGRRCWRWPAGAAGDTAAAAGRRSATARAARWSSPAKRRGAGA